MARWTLGTLVLIFPLFVVACGNASKTASGPDGGAGSVLPDGQQQGPDSDSGAGGVGAGGSDGTSSDARLGTGGMAGSSGTGGGGAGGLAVGGRAGGTGTGGAGFGGAGGSAMVGDAAPIVDVAIDAAVIDASPDAAVCIGPNPADVTCMSSKSQCVPSACACLQNSWACTADCRALPLCDAGAGLDRGPPARVDGSLDAVSDAAIPVEPFVAKSVSVGATYACALVDDGSLRCWGDNSCGQLGNGSFASSPVPVKVKGITNALVVSAGDCHTCAVLSSGAIQCWGSNARGELGDSQWTRSAVPMPVVGITNAVAVTTRGNAFTCALLADGTASCWGKEDYGELGSGVTMDQAEPMQVANIADGIAIQSGSSHTCVVSKSGAVQCWGRDMDGQIGDGRLGNNINATTPVSVLGVKSAVAIACGSAHACVILDDQTVTCWGSNAGPPYSTIAWTISATPLPVVSLAGVLAVAGGYESSCALLDDGTLRCWGNNANGELGDGTTRDRSSPVAVAGLSHAIAVSAGMVQTCALLDSGGIRCWGGNSYGQLGDGTTTDSPTPVNVAGTP